MVAGRVNYTQASPASAGGRENLLGGTPISPNEGEARVRQPRLADLDLEAHLANPEIKQRFVTPMFDIIAPRYDRFTRVFSFGMDRHWKAELVQRLTEVVAADANVVDLACGTGDLAFAAANRAVNGRVLGLDASGAMIQLATARAARDAPHGNVEFRIADISALDVPTASVDAITAGYALRNVPDYEQCIREIARVLRPGGVVLTLDFYRPQSAVWRTLFLSYLAAAGNWVGWLWHREPVVYGYIAPSIDHFVSWQRFSASLERHGLRVDAVHTKLLGGVALHFATRV